MSNVFSDYEPKVKVNVKPDSAGNVKEIEKDYHLHSNAKFKEESEGKDYFNLFKTKSSASFKIDSGTEDPFSFLLADGKHIKLKERPLAPYYRYNVAGKSYFDLSMRKMDEENNNAKAQFWAMYNATPSSTPASSPSTTPANSRPSSPTTTRSRTATRELISEAKEPDVDDGSVEVHNYNTRSKTKKGTIEVGSVGADETKQQETEREETKTGSQLKKEFNHR